MLMLTMAIWLENRLSDGPWLYGEEKPGRLYSDASLPSKNNAL